MKNKRKETRYTGQEQRKLRRYGITAGCIVMAVLVMTAFVGQKNIGEKTLLAQESMREEREEKREREIREKQIQAAMEEKALREAETDALLTGKTREVYQLLFDAMSRKEYGSAAQYLEENSEILEEFARETVQEEQYLFDGEKLKKEGQGYGLLVNASGVAYLGEWKDGLPEGEGAAVRALVLNDARFDLSEGQWSQGKMNGKGRTGYCYYNGVEEPRTKEIWKQGTFQEDLMEGEIQYTSVNASGAKTEWELNIKAGVTVLDDRWKKTEDEKQLRLPAQTDGMHEYVLDVQKADAVMWKNMVEWK